MESKSCIKLRTCIIFLYVLLICRSRIGLCRLPWSNIPDASVSLVGHTVFLHVSHSGTWQSGIVTVFSRTKKNQERARPIYSMKSFTEDVSICDFRQIYLRALLGRLLRRVYTTQRKLHTDPSKNRPDLTTFVEKQSNQYLHSQSPMQIARLFVLIAIT